MNHAFVSVIKFVSFTLLAVSSVAYAADEKKPVVVDTAKGEAIYNNGDAARGIPACISCHGAGGASTIAQNPKLAGQHAAYIYKQLLNFRGPDRKQAIMTTYAMMLSDEEMRSIAAFMDKQPASPGAAKNKATVDLGKQIYRAGIAEKNVPACAACHGPNGAGIPAQFPRMGGQHAEYTASQLNNFRSGARKNGPMMMTIAKRLSEDEIQAVSDYIAGLR